MIHIDLKTSNDLYTVLKGRSIKYVHASGWVCCLYILLHTHIVFSGSAFCYVYWVVTRNHACGCGMRACVCECVYVIVCV